MLWVSVLVRRNQSESAWWTREFEEEYVFPLSLGHSGLRDFVEGNKLLSVVRAMYIQYTLASQEARASQVTSCCGRQVCMYC